MDVLRGNRARFGALARFSLALEAHCPAVAKACALGLVQVVLKTRRAARLLSNADTGAQEGRALEPADLQRLVQHLDVSELLALFVHPRLALGLSERDFTEVLGPSPDCHWDSKAALHESHYRQNTQAE